MIALYITSPVRGSGKTTLCCGLGKHFLDKGKKVGFFKPTIATSGSNTDPDAQLVKDVLALAEPAESLSPVFADPAKLKEAYGKVAQDKDIVLIEGIFDKKIAEALSAKVVIIEGYSRETGPVTSYKDFSKSLLGVVLNKVPTNRLEHVRGEVVTRFNQVGINILGILPEDRRLLTISIGELAGRIQGQFLSGATKSSQLVENIMLGPKSLDSGLFYYQRKANKAAIIESERPDMQLAALDTPLKCLVLAGNEAPQPVVLHLAEDKEVPVIVTKNNIENIVMNIEDALNQVGFSREKVPVLIEIMEKHFNFKELDKALGI